MLETLCAVAEQSGVEAESVADFAALFVKDEEMEDMFYAAIRDSRRNGFRDGVKAALTLFAEIR